MTATSTLRAFYLHYCTRLECRLIDPSQDSVICQSSEGESSTFSAWKYLVKAVDICSSPWITLQFRQLPNNMGAALVVSDGEYQHLIFPVLPKSNDEEEED